MARATRSGTRADTALLAVSALLALFITVLPTPVREAIAATLRRTVVAPLLGLQERAERARDAFAERDEVTARVDSLALRVAELEQMGLENQQLRGLLALGRSLRWGFLPAEALHGQLIGGEEVLMLTVGSAAGARPGTAVVSPDGLVGKVTSTDPARSIAIMWTHRDFRASAMAADGSAFGIVRPHVGEAPNALGAREAPERYLLQMRGVAFRDALKPGTLVVTSGLGGVYPRGIPIGTVLGELQTTEQWSRTYLLRPAVRPPDVSNVMILLPERAVQPLDGVWSSVASANDAMRGIAAAGDSIAQSAADSLAAQQRAADSLAVRDAGLADSVRRDSTRPPR